MTKPGWSPMRAVASVLSMVVVLGPGAAQAVPSYARQTGLACEACHTAFPELTPYGRRFKLNGYTIDNLPQVSGISPNKQETLLLNQLPPLSFMFQTSYTRTKSGMPDSALPGALAKNGQVLFPQQASLFYAGRIAPNLGAFVQMTYDGTDAEFGWDNTDIRYARPVNENFLWGLSLNNNPTVQDPWNSTPAWQVPFDQRSSVAPSPGAATMLDGGLVDAGVAGLTAYAYLYDSLYLELGGYHSAPAAAQLDSTSTNVVRDLAPYWRIAYEHQWGRHSWEIGAYGVVAKIHPGGGIALSGPTNKYEDWALDSQYQYIGDDHIVSVSTTYIDEKQTLDSTYGAGASTNASDRLKTFRIGTSYLYQRKYGAALGYFRTTGSSDALLYPSGAPVVGFANGSPNSNGWTGELDWLPYQNLKLALQYTGYSKFNGASSNYDGNGRNASDNDTSYLLFWFNY